MQTKRRKQRRGCLFLGFILLMSISVNAQEGGQIEIAAPFLTITPDSRAAGFGDQGAATTADNNSQFWNPAKYLFASYKGGVSYTYTPWLKNVASGINLHNIAGFYKVDGRQAVSASLRYFSIGDIPIWDINGNVVKEFKPNEFAVDLAYSRKLSEHLSGSVAFRFIRSDLTGGISIPNVSGNAGESNSVSSVAADVALYYQRVLANNNEFALGLNLSNLGPKVSYSSSSEKAFIPATFRLGGRYTFNLNAQNKISALIETSKLMVPSPNYKNGVNTNADKTVLEGVFSSFGDAPGGFSEELKEFTYSIGAEYYYANRFGVRTGYFHESQMKGNRKFFTFGVGVNYNIFAIDLAYLAPTNSGSNNPLGNTIRFTVGAQIGK